MDWNLNLVSGDELEEIAKERRKDKFSINVSNNLVNSYEKQGFTIIKPGKSKSKMIRDKSFDEIFENELWLVFKKMGFEILNKDRNLDIDLNGNSQQIDILAIDKETILVVECKSSRTINKNYDFKTELEALDGKKDEIAKEISKKYQNRKIKFIFATKNYALGKADLDRISKFDLAYFDYDTVLYYRDLANHLGSAAKYQLLGNLFQKVKIKGLNTNVNALRGKMGGLTYYSFLIEPEKMLKLAYILHRNNANKANAPTYQRIVKKERLKAIREFVNNGGYFPNSLICSIDGNVKFEQSSQIIQDTVTRSGILKLPQTYMSMYIIDGQHRLYGYSDSKYAANDVIPVVAFENMEKDEQVKMFMDINENQKPVNKSLRNTLNADLLWDSKDPRKQREALSIKIAESLGTNRTSPLFDRVIIGEEPKTAIRCITTDAIKKAIEDSNFLNRYDKKSNKKSSGTFDLDNNDSTYDSIVPFLIDSLNIIVEKNKKEWNKGGNGYLSFNNTVYAFIKIISDIVDIEINGLIDEDSFNKCKKMINEFADVVSNLDEESLKELRKYGDGGKKNAWNVLQLKLNEKEPKYINPELTAYLEEHSMKNNSKAKELLLSLEVLIRSKLKQTVSDKKIIEKCKPVYNKMGTYLNDKKAENILNDTNEQIDMWDGISFNEFSQLCAIVDADEIITLFSNENFVPKTKKDIVNWQTVFADSMKKIEDNKPVIQKNYELIKEVYEGLIGEVKE